MTGDLKAQVLTQALFRLARCRHPRARVVVWRGLSGSMLCEECRNCGSDRIRQDMSESTWSKWERPKLVADLGEE
jgi:hypothetical protein